MTPFEELLAFSMNAGQGQAEASFQVPPGNRMVIEFVTAILTVPAGEKAAVTFFVMTGNVPAPGLRHALVLIPQGTFGSGDVFSASQLVKLYPNPGSRVIFQFARNGFAGPASGNISLTGFFE